MSLTTYWVSVTVLILVALLQGWWSERKQYALIRLQRETITRLIEEKDDVQGDLADAEHSLARLNSMAVGAGLQELARAIVRLDSYRSLSGTVAMRAVMRRLDVVQGEGSTPTDLVDAAEAVSEQAALVVESLDSARATMADVRELLGGVARQLTREEDHGGD